MGKQKLEMETQLRHFFQTSDAAARDEEKEAQMVRLCREVYKEQMCQPKMSALWLLAHEAKHIVKRMGTKYLIATAMALLVLFGSTEIGVLKNIPPVWLLLFFIPWFVFAALPELFRTMACGMKELECSTKAGYSRILFSRICYAGIFSVLSILAVCFALHVWRPDMWGSGLLLLEAFAIFGAISYICLCLANHFSTDTARTLCVLICVACSLSAIVLGPLFARPLLSLNSTFIMAIVLAIAAAGVLQQSKKMLFAAKYMPA